MKRRKDIIGRGIDQFAKDFPKGHPIQFADHNIVGSLIGLRQNIIESQKSLESKKGNMSRTEFNKQRKVLEDKKTDYRKEVTKATGTPSVGGVVLEQVMQDKISFHPKDKALSLTRDVLESSVLKNQKTDRVNIMKMDPQKDLLPPEPQYITPQKYPIKENKGKFSSTPPESRSVKIKDGKISSTSPDRKSVENKETTTEKPTQTPEETTNDKSTSIDGIGSKIGDFAGKLGSVGLGFLDKIAKVTDAVHDSVMKEPSDITEQERDDLMTSSAYSDRADPLFNPVQKQVEDSFKFQYPGKSKSSHTVEEVGMLPKEPQPIKDVFGNDIEPTVLNIRERVASSVDEIGEGPAVRDFQSKLNKLSWEDTGISPVKNIMDPNWDKGGSFNTLEHPQYPRAELKTDGVFGQKTNNRAKEAVAEFGVDVVDSLF
jgi:predicted flap endonuclease-1-like 5' DNA nuclease